jgi:hypothetical protein
VNGSGLRLNRRAIAELRGVPGGLSPGSSWRSRGRVRVRQPDGRDLTLTVAATDDGAVRDEHGEWVGDDGLAHGDVTGDLGRHHDAAQVIGAVTRTGYLDLPLPDEESQEVDAGWLERRDRDVIDDAIDRWRPVTPTAAPRTAGGPALRDRAERAAAATRTERLAAADGDLARIELHRDHTAASGDGLDDDAVAVAEQRVTDAESSWREVQGRLENAEAAAEAAQPLLAAAEGELDAAEHERWAALYAVRIATRQVRQADHERAHERAATGSQPAQPRGAEEYRYG